MELPLNAFRAFDAAARLGSFKAAAAELAVTPAAISHQIKKLELRLGVVLFERADRKLQITPAGRRLKSAVAIAFGELEAVIDELTDHGLIAGSRVLRITAAPSIAGKWLAPRLDRFQALRPNLEVRLSGTDALVDLGSRHDVDFAVRYGVGDYGADLAAEPLWPASKIVAVCAPALLESTRIETPRDLLSVPLLRTGFAALSTAMRSAQVGWAAWLARAGITGREAESAATSGPFFGSTQLTLEVTAAGKGFALTPLVLVENELASGRLVRPFLTALDDPCRYWLLYRKQRAGEPKIAAFTRWILQEAAETAGGCAPR